MLGVAGILAALHKVGVAWDEVLHEGMPELLVQNWRGCTTRDQALAMGKRCIVSAPYYLDLMYPAEMHYAFDPCAPQAQLVALEDAQQCDQRLEHVAEGIGWTRQWRAGAIERGSTPDTGEVLAARLVCGRNWSTNTPSMFVSGRVCRR